MKMSLILKEVDYVGNRKNQMAMKFIRDFPLYHHDVKTCIVEPKQSVHRKYGPNFLFSVPNTNMTSNERENIATKDTPVPDMSRPKYGCFLMPEYTPIFMVDKLPRIDAFDKDSSKL